MKRLLFSFFFRKEIKKFLDIMEYRRTTYNSEGLVPGSVVASASKLDFIELFLPTND